MSRIRRGTLSMSGYGRGVAEKRGWRAFCELRAVNHRYLDISLFIPEHLLAADHALRRLIKATLRRGHVDVNVSLTPLVSSRKTRPKLNMRLARWYAERFRRLARSMKLPRPRADALARMPGVVEERAITPSSREALSAVLAAARAALARLGDMRVREGRALCGDVMKRLKGVEEGIGSIARAWPAAREGHWGRIADRLQEALVRLDRGRQPAKAREIMALIERGDVSEELARLRSLCGQFRRTVLIGSPAGRRLDFLAQELQREANTLAAKCAGASMTGKVLALREEVERIREQVQNIE